MHAVAEVLGVKCAVEVAAAVIIVAGVVVLAVCCLTFDVAIRGVVVVLGNLHLLWFHCWGRITDYYS